MWAPSTLQHHTRPPPPSRGLFYPFALDHLKTSNARNFAAEPAQVSIAPYGTANFQVGVSRLQVNRLFSRADCRLRVDILSAVWDPARSLRRRDVLQNLLFF